MNQVSKVFDRKGMPLLAAAFAILFVLETARQLRQRKISRVKRVIVNTVVSIPAFSLLRFLLLPVMIKLSGGQRRSGVSVAPHLPSHFLRNLAVFLLLDASNYLWHVLLHKIPLLWRFHVVHHSDPDLDISTALRFHFGEIVASVLFRAPAVAFIGASARQIVFYEIVFEAATQFHHSNTKIPFHAERILSHFIVTPRMHGIHHSVIKNETDSNYSVIFSFWDRLFKTLRLNVHQHEVVTGVPMYPDAGDLTIGQLLSLPFKKVKSWNKELLERDNASKNPDVKKLLP